MLIYVKNETFIWYVLPAIVRLKCNMIFDMSSNCNYAYWDWTLLILIGLWETIRILELLLLLQKNKTFEKKYFT